MPAATIAHEAFALAELVQAGCHLARVLELLKSDAAVPDSWRLAAASELGHWERAREKFETASRQRSVSDPPAAPSANPGRPSKATGAGR